MRGRESLTFNDVPGNLLRNKEHASAVFSGALEGTEVSWHRADIVRNEHSLPFRRQRQNLGISHAAQSSRLSGQEIQRWLSAQDSAHNGIVEIGVRQKPNLHDKRV